METIRPTHSNREGGAMRLPVSDNIPIHPSAPSEVLGSLGNIPLGFKEKRPRRGGRTTFAIPLALRRQTGPLADENWFSGAPLLAVFSFARRGCMDRSRRRGFPRTSRARVPAPQGNAKRHKPQSWKILSIGKTHPIRLNSLHLNGK